MRPGIGLGRRGENLCRFANNFDPQPLQPETQLRLFNAVFIRACQFCAKPRQSCRKVPELLGDTATQKVFDSLLTWASKLPENQRVDLFHECFETASGFIFMSVMSDKSLSLCRFLLALAKHIPDTAPSGSETGSQRAIALHTVLDQFPGKIFTDLRPLVALEAAVDVIKSLPNAAERCDAIVKAAEQYSASNNLSQLGWTQKQAALDLLLATARELPNEQLRSRAVDHIIAHYPAAAFQPWQRLAMVQSLAEATINMLTTDVHRHAVVNKIIDNVFKNSALWALEPGEATQVMVALLKVIDGLSSDKHHAAALCRLIKQSTKTIPDEEKSEIFSALMASGEKLSEQAERSVVETHLKSFFAGLFMES